MPRESAFIGAIHPEWQWGAQEHLLASLIDLTGQANSKRGTWKRVARPTDKQPNVIGAGPGVSIEELEARLAAVQDGGGDSDG